MKSNGELKNIGFDSLSGNWGIAILAGLVASALIGGASGISSSFSSVSSDTVELFWSTEITASALVIITIVTVIAMFFGLIVSLAYSLLSGVIRAGYAKFNLNLVDGNTPAFRDIFSYFGYWKNTALAELLTVLYVTLGYIAFIIPGIIFSLNYAMVPYILAEKPNTASSEALEISKLMMHGNRMKYFGLMLSFIGWDILAVLTLGIGYIWLTPYKEATRAAFYKDVSGEYQLTEQYTPVFSD